MADNRKVIITGAGKGLGLEMTRLHMETGDYVYAITHSMTDELKEIASENSNITIFEVELTNEKEIAVFAEKIEGEIDVIYNVAGLYYEEDRVGIKETDMDSVLKLYQVNAMAPIMVVKHNLDKLSPNGIIVNVSSEAGSIGASRRGSEYGYCMAKAALNMASKNLSNELKDTGIKVCCYHPGWMRTQMGGARAAASSESISAKEAADSLYNKVINEGLENEISFFDYLGNKWEW